MEKQTNKEIVEKLIIERDDLKIKYRNLYKFIKEENSMGGVEPYQGEKLREQLSAMRKYLEILYSRIGYLAE